MYSNIVETFIMLNLSHWTAGVKTDYILRNSTEQNLYA